ncbi:hypothetical protein [Halorubrum trueperi]|uniref:Uncharacterized protein n=1 Tax=Halorubrum trueperi TaxID=2004704 RepID=A0ABD5UG61_9EURY
MEFDGEFELGGVIEAAGAVARPEPKTTPLPTARVSPYDRPPRR